MGRRTRRGPVVGGLVGVEGLVGDLLLEVEPVPEGEELGLGHLLDLVGGVAGLDLGAEGPALHRLGQDDRRLAGRLRGLGGQLVGGVELPVVVAAPGSAWISSSERCSTMLAQSGIGTEEVLPGVGARLGDVLLELPVGSGVHLVQQDAVDVAGQELVPLGAPDHLDHVPAGPPEGGLGLLDDLAVAPDGTVEALEVAVDDEDQVVEVFPAGHREGAGGFHLVELTVTDEAPDPRGRGVGDLPVEEIAVDVGLVDGGQRAEAHGDGGVLPEVGEQAGVGIGGQAPAARPPGGNCRAGPRRAGPRRRPGRRCRARRGPGRRPCRRSPRRTSPGRSG